MNLMKDHQGEETVTKKKLASEDIGKDAKERKRIIEKESVTAALSCPTFVP